MHSMAAPTSNSRKYVYEKLFELEKKKKHCYSRGTWITLSYIHTLYWCVHICSGSSQWHDLITQHRQVPQVFFFLLLLFFCAKTQSTATAGSSLISYTSVSILPQYYQKQAQWGDVQDTTIDLWFIHQILMSLSKTSSAFAISKATRHNLWSEGGWRWKYLISRYLLYVKIDKNNRRWIKIKCFAIDMMKVWKSNMSVQFI